MNDIKILLGARIKELRRSLNLTQEQMAEQIGIEPNNLSRIENGKNFPSPENLSKIALALNVDIKDLFAFNHLKSYKEIKDKIVSIIENDENTARLLYKFYETIK